MSSVSASANLQKQSDSPVCIVQFWDKNIPQAVAQLTQGVAQMNSGLPYLIFDDESAAEFIRKEIGSDVLKLYNRCAIPAMRADLFRYCFLARRGGVYIDADFPAVASIEPLVTAHTKGCLYLREKGLTNSMMYLREPGNSLAQTVLEVAIENISTKSSNSVWQVTGPHILQSLYADKDCAALFDDIHIIDEAEFALYFKPAVSLDYKRDDSHWLVARQKGLKIFKD